MHIALPAFVIAAVLAFPAVARPQDGPGAPPTGGTAPAGDPSGAPPVVAKPDPAMPVPAFLRQAAQDDVFEIALGKFAMSAATAAQVKDFGHRMATNHAAIEVLVAKSARKQGTEIPAGLSPEDAAEVDRLKALQGADFDHAYARLMSERSRKALEMYRWQYDNCTDPDVKAFAMGTLPIMATHQRLAEAMHQEVNKEEIRAEAERKAAEAKAAEQKRAEEAAAANAKKKPAAAPPKKPRKPMGVP